MGPFLFISLLEYTAVDKGFVSLQEALFFNIVSFVCVYKKLTCTSMQRYPEQYTATQYRCRSSCLTSAAVRKRNALFMLGIKNMCIEKKKRFQTQNHLVHSIFESNIGVLKIRGCSVHL